MVTASNDSHYLTPNEEFEYWSNLAKTDPLRFETERQTVIEEVISSAPAKRQQELRQLQWRIDMERRKAKNPTDAMIRLQKMMWRHFYADNGFIFAVRQLQKVCHHAEKLIASSIQKNAEIIPFKKD